jgi:hypothetical protein
LSEAQEWVYRLMNDPEYFEKERYIDSINVYSSVIEEFQKLYEQTPAADRSARTRILSGMKMVVMLNHLQQYGSLIIPSQHNHNNESNDNDTREHDLYWIQSLGLWGCKYCDLRLDKFGMQNTLCKRNKKAKW